jgi:hypothetical protein
LDQDDTALRAVCLKGQKDVVGVGAGGNEWRQEPRRRGLWTGENKCLDQTKEPDGYVGTIHGTNMPESRLVNPAQA